MTRRLLLDFDGTLVDSRRRQYELFMELAGAPPLPFDEYWRRKRAGMTQPEMLRSFCRYTEVDIASFRRRWLATIEEPARLDVDVLIAGVPEFLERARRGCELYLVTGRQHFDSLVAQMRKLGIHSAFMGVLNTEQRRTKLDLVRSCGAPGGQDVFIGDTGEDILTGKELGAYTVGVTSGASSAETLRRYAPDLVVDSVAALDPMHLGRSAA
jgi:phosphoglycolate phosphatase